jgi:hypothetical protein
LHSGGKKIPVDGSLVGVPALMTSPDVGMRASRCATLASEPGGEAQISKAAAAAAVAVKAAPDASRAEPDDVAGAENVENDEVANRRFDGEAKILAHLEENMESAGAVTGTGFVRYRRKVEWDDVDESVEVSHCRERPRDGFGSCPYSYG